MADSRDILGKNRKFKGTAGVVMPKGSTAERVDTESGELRFNTSTELMEYYDGNQWKPIGALVTVTTATGGDAGYIDVNTSSNFTLTGTGFASVPRVSAFQTSTGVYTDATVVSFISATELTVTISVPVSGDYFVKVENPDGATGVSTTAILQASPSPIWQTASGSLGTIGGGSSVNLSVSASTVDSSAITFSETTAILTSDTDTPATTMNLSLNSSTGAITGTAPDVANDTTYTFTLRATDLETQTADRQFSITVQVANYFGDETDGELNTTP